MADPFIKKVIAAYGGADNSFAYSKERWPAAAGIADQVCELLEVATPARILDLACGSGSCTTALALKGFDVTGIDCTPSRIKVARRMSKEKQAPVQWLCKDIRHIDYEEEFDCVCLLDVIFGIFESEEEDRELIRRIAAALKVNGRCLFEVYNREFALKHGVEGKAFFDQQTGTFASRERGGCTLSMRLYSHEEWRLMLKREGLRVIKMGGWWTWPGDPQPPPWRADFIVAQKDRPDR